MLKEFLEDVLNFIEVGVSFFFLKLDDILPLILPLIKVAGSF
jgi:hypothetical protein